MAEIYNANPNLKAIGVSVDYTPEQFQEYVKCKSDYIYFIENYCQIVTLDKGLQPFKLYECQKKKLDIIHNNRKVILMEGRQQGKCHTKNTKYKVRNKKTGETLYVTAEQFHNIAKENM
jgi:hypothetical protein